MKILSNSFALKVCKDIELIKNGSKEEFIALCKSFDFLENPINELEKKYVECIVERLVKENMTLQDITEA